MQVLSSTPIIHSLQFRYLLSVENWPAHQASHTAVPSGLSPHNAEEHRLAGKPGRGVDGGQVVAGDLIRRPRDATSVHESRERCGRDSAGVEQLGPRAVGNLDWFVIRLVKMITRKRMPGLSAAFACCPRIRIMLSLTPCNVEGGCAPNSWATTWGQYGSTQPKPLTSCVPGLDIKDCTSSTGFGFRG